MASLGLAFRAFFGALRDRAFAGEVRGLLTKTPLAPAAGALKQPAPREAGAVAISSPPQRKTLVRNDAVSLLAVLQREGRLIDFIKEPIDAYSDAQIGAAVRDVHRNCAAAIERMLALRPVMAQSEGAAVETPAGFDAGRIRLTGNVSGLPPFKGTLRHGGWEATKVELPEWTGSESAARVVAPAEVELQ